MARFENGWVLLSRDCMSGDIAQRGPITVFVWLRLLCMANWRESSTYAKGQQVKLKPGQLVTGLTEIAAGTMSIGAVRKALQYLESSARIEQATSNQGRIITICKWEEYQSLPTDEDRRGTSIEQVESKRRANGEQHIEPVNKGTIINTGSTPQEIAAEQHESPKKTFTVQTANDLKTAAGEPAMATWVGLYSREYVDRELAKILVWLSANPAKNRKSKRGWTSFLAAWFDRGWKQYQAAIPVARASPTPIRHKPCTEVFIEQAAEGEHVPDLTPEERQEKMRLVREKLSKTGVYGKTGA